MKKRRARARYTNWDNLLTRWSISKSWWQVDKDCDSFVLKACAKEF